MSAATTQHRISFALALRAISPSLAALHASRIRLEHGDVLPLTPLTCVRCGHAPVSVRSVRKKGNAKGRVVERKCAACSFVEAAPTTGDLIQLASTRKARQKSRMQTLSLSSDAPSAGPSIVSSSRSTPVPATARIPDAAPKKSKKKSGLQEMLARNRQRQEQEKKDTARGQGGLSSFLDGL